MPSPSMTTSNVAGNLLASTSIPASGSTSFTIDLSAKFEGQVQVSATFGTVAATAGLRVDVYRRIGSGPVADTAPISSVNVVAVAASTVAQSLALPTGRYSIKLTNLDATNAVTAVTATDDTVDSVA